MPTSGLAGEHISCMGRPPAPISTPLLEDFLLVYTPHQLGSLGLAKIGHDLSRVDPRVNHMGLARSPSPSAAARRGASLSQVCRVSLLSLFLPQLASRGRCGSSAAASTHGPGAAPSRAIEEKAEVGSSDAAW